MMEISTSILNSNNRVESVMELNRTNTSYIHIDVMDGKFVSDTQFSVKEIVAINRITKYPMDVHLMVNDPLMYINELQNMNISYITFHLEMKKDIKKIIDKIKNLGYKVGISIKPGTDINELVPYLKDIDMVLIMSVEPGLGGQKFLNGTVNRINELKKIIDKDGYNIKIEVDGGINDITIKKLECVDIVVVGSYIVKSDNYYNRINSLLESFNNRGKNIKLVKIKKFILNLMFIFCIILLALIFIKINYAK